ncbi:MAG TPA: DUF1206 domain-containing protein [Thermoanaerobaculia bacterium]
MLRRLLTRFGYAALGAVYVSLGVVAVRVAFAGARDRVHGFPGAFRFLLSQKEGSTIVTGIAVGLGAFVLARLVDAADPRWTRLGRLFAFIDAIAHAGLAWVAVTLLRRQRTGSFSRPALAWVVAQRWGPTALETAGLVVVAIGAFQIWQGMSGGLRRQLVRRRKLEAVMPFALRVGRFGYIVRGVVTLIIGWFLFRVARDADPSKFHEIGGALDVIHHVPYGSALLVIAGFGLGAYGIYLVLLGFFRRPS